MMIYITCPGVMAIVQYPCHLAFTIRLIHTLLGIMRKESCALLHCRWHNTMFYALLDSTSNTQSLPTALSMNCALIGLPTSDARKFTSNTRASGISSACTRFAVSLGAEHP